MSKPFHWQDPDDLPDPVRPLVYKHNALAADVDSISGATEEEKKEAWELFKKTRTGWHWLHAKRFNIGLATAQTWLILKILEAFGINLKQYGPGIYQFVLAIFGG